MESPMKANVFIRVLVIVLVVVVGFWLYGIGRTMRETVGFNVTALCSGLLLGFALPLTVFLPLLISRTVWPVLKSWTELSSFRALVVALLIGCLLSESWILRDERKFSAETSQATLDRPYSRPRAWPNTGSSLIFVPGKGIHATD